LRAQKTFSVNKNLLCHSQFNFESLSLSLKHTHTLSLSRTHTHTQRFFLLSLVFHSDDRTKESSQIITFDTFFSIFLKNPFITPFSSLTLSHGLMIYLLSCSLQLLSPSICIIFLSLYVSRAMTEPWNHDKLYFLHLSQPLDNSYHSLYLFDLSCFRSVCLSVFLFIFRFLKLKSAQGPTFKAVIIVS